MDFFENQWHDGNLLDEISLTFSEQQDEVLIELPEGFIMPELGIEHPEHRVSFMIDALKNTFERLSMNVHLNTVSLLGDLSCSELLMYYSIVTDYLYIRNSSDDVEASELITPEQFVIETNEEKACHKTIDFVCKVSDFAVICMILKHLKNREFKILSNTFHMDGSDFILFLEFKSVFGYHIRIKFLVQCKDKEAAEALHSRFVEIQLNYVDVGESDA